MRHSRDVTNPCQQDVTVDNGGKSACNDDWGEDQGALGCMFCLRAPLCLIRAAITPCHALWLRYWTLTSAQGLGFRVSAGTLYLLSTVLPSSHALRLFRFPLKLISNLFDSLRCLLSSRFPRYHSLTNVQGVEWHSATLVG